MHQKTIQNKTAGQAVPRIISWNTTLQCNLNCNHCYMDSKSMKDKEELSTIEAKKVIDEISRVSKPLLVLSGGEPLMRDDILDLASYGTERGLRVALGTNGTLIDDSLAKKIMDSGIRSVAISVDSSHPSIHDSFRGVDGAWRSAIEGVKACTRNGIKVQFNTTVTSENYNDLDNIVNLAKSIDVKDLHLFFLVPTGRGSNIQDITPFMYEKMIKDVLTKYSGDDINVKPTCAPQFMRIARQNNINTGRYSKGCIAGINYCRIYPNGDITPCPYLPIRLGNIRENEFEHIWRTNPILKKLRNPEELKGKCGSCDYKAVCGGCRARAYGLTIDQVDSCGGLHEYEELKGDYLAADPWCLYNPL